MEAVRPSRDLVWLRLQQFVLGSGAGRREVVQLLATLPSHEGANARCSILTLCVLCVLRE